MEVKEVRTRLIQLSEESMRAFHQKLCPDAGRPILGIRIPRLRALAKEIVKGDWQAYLAEGQEEYHEEVQLKGLVIGYARLPFSQKLKLIQAFVPKIDSWAICDTFCPTLKIRPEELSQAWDFIQPYTRSDKEFDVRFAVIMMLDYFLTDAYAPSVLQILDSIRHEGYYAKMGVAWTLAELGVKYNAMTMAYLKEGPCHLDDFTYNKALQKMRESYRIDAGQKEELKRMRR